MSLFLPPETPLPRHLFVTALAVIWLSSHAVAATATLGDVSNVPTEGGRTLSLRLWVPDNTTGAKVRGILVASHPSGTEGATFQQDYRPLAGNPQDSYWVETTTTEYNATRRMDLAMQLVARRHNFAVIGLYFSGQHPGGFTDPLDVSMMPAQAAALEAGIAQLASTYNRPELVTAPIATYGFSGGSGFSLYYAAYNPARCIAVAHNKGGSVGDYDPVFLEAAEQVPVLLCYGAEDTPERIAAIKNTFAYHRANGAVWSLIPDYGLAHHSQGYGRFLGAAYFDRIIEKRLPKNWVPGTAPTLMPLDESSGWLGDNTTWESNASAISTFASAAVSLQAKRTMSWLPDQFFAEAWRSVTTHLPSAKLTSPKSSTATTIPAQLSYLVAGGSQVLELTAPDPDAIASVEWQVGNVTIGTSNTAPYSFTMTNLAPGVHLVRSKLNLAAGGTSTSDLGILLVKPSNTNSLPTILSGPGVGGTAYAGMPVACSALASDPDGSIEELLTYTWSTTVAPGAVVFGAGNGTNAGKNITATFPVPGAYTLRVSVKDAIGNSTPTTATVSVTVVAQPPGTLAFSAPFYSVIEGDSGSSIATITVTRTVGANGTVGVRYTTANGTASVGSDYSASSGNLTWAAGDFTDKSFTISIAGDSTYETDETVALSLSSPTGGALLGSPNAGTLTITNDDPAPQLYSAWATANGLAGPNALDLASPAGDGIPNLVKYALGLNPNQTYPTSGNGENPGLPLIEFNLTTLSLTYQRDSTKSDVNYTVEVSDDLATWKTNGVTEAPGAVQGTLQTFRASVNTSPGKAKFIRLKVAR